MANYKISLEELVRANLSKAIEAMNDQTAEDVLRMYKDQATLLFVTEQVKSALRTDPFQHLGERDAQSAVGRLQKLLRVTDYHNVTTLEGYSRIEGVVRIIADPPMKPTIASHVELKFRYVRQATNPATVSFSIDLTKDYDMAERLLWADIQAVGTVPSSNKVKNIVRSDDDDDDSDDWSDMEDDSLSNVPDAYPTAIYPTNQGVVAEAYGCLASSNTSSCDQFVAGIDPDILLQFLQWTRIGPMDDITAFFLIMTIPFYEQEWDLVGYLLEAVFGSDEDDDEELE